MALVKAERSEAQLEEGEQLRISGLKGWVLVKEFWDWTHTLEGSRRPEGSAVNTINATDDYFRNPNKC